MKLYKYNIHQQKLYSKQIWLAAKIQACKEAGNDKGMRFFEQQLIKYDRCARALQLVEIGDTTMTTLNRRPLYDVYIEPPDVDPAFCYPDDDCPDYMDAYHEMIEENMAEDDFK
jgi:hypothetical protein